MTRPCFWELRRLLVQVYLTAVIVTVVVAVVVAVGFAAWARRWLDLPFTGVEAAPSEAQAIFAGNARIALAVFGAAAAVNAPWITARGHTVSPSRSWKIARLACDLLLALTAANNLFIVGVAVGGYRLRMVGALLPHGPLELLGFSLALCLYLRARRGPVDPGTWALAAGGAAVALAAGALLEVFVSL